MSRQQDILVMGVSGSGKTTVGKAVAASLGLLFLDADDFHPPENVAKMAAGLSLTDQDREPWLAAIAGKLTALRSEGRPFVLACSALKERYREILVQAAPGLVVIWLQGSPDLIRERMLAREHHFMPSALLESQFVTLEPPASAIRLDIRESIADLASRIHVMLGSR
jgi:carbohydrate kinase (thermoresistant glucokinase family)